MACVTHYTARRLHQLNSERCELCAWARNANVLNTIRTNDKLLTFACQYMLPIPNKRNTVVMCGSVQWINMISCLAAVLHKYSEINKHRDKKKQRQQQHNSEPTTHNIQRGKASEYAWTIACYLLIHKSFHSIWSFWMSYCVSFNSTRSFIIDIFSSNCSSSAFH